MSTRTAASGNFARALRVLHLASDPAVTARVRAALEHGERVYQVERAGDRAVFDAVLARNTFDLVLTEHAPPERDAAEVVSAVRAVRANAPVIVVSDACGEEVAVELIKSGASDFVLAHDLTRLARAVDRALRESREQSERDAAEAAMRFAAAISTLIPASYDEQEILENFARYVVPRLGDWSAIDMATAEATDDPRTRRVAAVAHDPAWLAHAQAYRAPLDLDLSETPPLCVAARQVHETRDVATLLVPLVARGRTLGTLILGRAAHAYSPAEIALAEEVARLLASAVDGARLYREAHSAVRARDEFLSIASHELRTPLTSLQLQIQVLLGSARKGALCTQQPERVAARLEAAERQSKRLARLINELLDISRISNGRLHVEREDVELLGLVRDVVSRFDDEIALSGSTVVVRSAGPHAGRWDRARLEQVVTNLLSNAIEYGQGKPIEVSLEAAEGAVLLRVRDNGIGIDAGDAARIFERFERTVATRNYGGLGLGLYITRQIVNAHGGAIRVVDGVTPGSLFEVRLPRA